MTRFLLSTLTLAACTDRKGGDSASFDDDTLATDLWSQAQSYASWTVAPGSSDTPTLSVSHSGKYVVTWYNPTLAAWDGSGVAPEGSIALKEAWTDEAGTTPTDNTIMQKIGGYDPGNSDWFWANVGPDGTAGSVGRLSMCSGCHADAGTDYLYLAVE